MINKKSWKTGSDVSPVFLYTLKNETMEVDITNYGATMVSIRVKDREKKPVDVLLGYESFEDYYTGEGYFGGLVGRCANRIHGGSVTLEGKTYGLALNDGPNQLHSAQYCTAVHVWDVDEECSDETHLYMTYCDEEHPGEGGYPGTIHFAACYELTKDGGISLSVKGMSDKTTIMNLTSHGYFHLGGHKSGDISDQKVQIFANKFTPLAKQYGIPSGEIKSVEGTALDFRQLRALGEGIDSMDEQVQIAHGYDHNFLLDGEVLEDGMRLAAIAQCEKTGIRMREYTNCPCVQLYTGNFINPAKGKEGAFYEPRHGFCIEAQYTPNAVHMEGVDKPIVEANTPYEFKLVMKFDTIE